MTDKHPKGWCIHYVYDPETPRIADARCNAGVRYGDIAGGGEHGIWTRLPCFLNENGEPKNPGCGECNKLRPPTEEEILAYDEHIRKLIAEAVAKKAGL